MVVLYQSQTLPINPPGVEPMLTVPQFWEVMILKCRKPELFVKAMSASEVLEETENLIKRTVTFKEGMGPAAGKVREDITLQKPWKVDFKNLTSGAFIQNIVSQGQDEKDLYLTFYFDWPRPDIQKGSEEEKAQSNRLWSMAKETVQHTIDYARSMAQEGKLKDIRAVGESA